MNHVDIFANEEHSGIQLEKFIAQLPEVQAAVTRGAHKIHRNASLVLDTQSKVRTGTSTIHVEKEGLDRLVVLDDTRGYAAAGAIEKGAKDGRGGVHPLQIGADMAKVGRR